jgi:hypothetical protein
MRIHGGRPAASVRAYVPGTFMMAFRIFLAQLSQCTSMARMTGAIAGAVLYRSRRRSELDTSRSSTRRVRVLRVCCAVHGQAGSRSRSIYIQEHGGDHRARGSWKH